MSTSKKVLCLVLLLQVLDHCLCDVLGVHGFVKMGSVLATSTKSQVQLTQVKMELHTTSGNRLMETDCAPNGYFFIPVPKAGKYVVKAKGSQGWSFTPHHKTIECGSTQCQSGEDVVFEVEGFSIKGRVNGRSVDGCQRKSASLHSVLMSLQPVGHEQRNRVGCAKDGSFSFNGVMPGEYLVFAEHHAWNIIGPKEGFRVSLGWESFKMESVFVVHGFTVNGKVSWGPQPMGNIVVSLFGSHVDDILPKSLDNGLELPGYVKSTLTADMELLSSCKTDDEGAFRFESVPCGSYIIIPWFMSDAGEATYHFSPSVQPIQVPYGDLEIIEAFQVSTLLIKGQVLHGATKQGISAVEVVLNGDSVSRTNEDGYYQLHAKVNEPLNLEFLKESHLFPSLKDLRISSKENVLPEVFPSSYAVCGSVIADEGQEQQTSQGYTLRLSSMSNQDDLKETDGKGEFCFWLEPGSYTLEVLGSVVFAPKSRRIEIVNSPLFNVKFVQKRISLQVSITKMQNSEWSPDLHLNLKSTDDTSQFVLHLGLEDFIEEDGQLYGSFKEILPGEYTLEVVKEGWCWQESQKHLVLSDNDVELQSFVHIGFEKRFILSHDAKLSFEGAGIDYVQNGFYKGGEVHTLCFTSSSLHYVNAEEQGCFVFNKNMVMDPTDSATLTVSAYGFKTQGTIQLPLSVDPSEIKLKVVSTVAGVKQNIQPYQEDEEGKILKYELIGYFGEEIEITPQHSTLVFQPSSVHYSHSGSHCASLLQPFIGQQGIFITGQISPAVDDVEVELWRQGLAIGDGMSASDGKFSFGPFYEDIDDFHLVVEKSGYEFSISKIHPHEYSVEAIRLVKVEVSILMKKKDKSGILVALTGIEKGFRSNAQTNEDGVVSFWKLPKDSYYIKPMLKEYEFSPNFQQIDVDGNKDEQVQFQGVRTGFSAHGMVLSLNNNVLPDVTVVAIAEDNEESCLSDEKGKFHLQNLKPNLQYTIKVLVIPPIRKSWPDETEITVPYDAQYKEHYDLKDLKFVVFKDDGKVTISGVVKLTDQEKMNATEIQVLKMTKGEGTYHVVAHVHPYLSGWFEKDVTYPGKYQIKVLNKQLDAHCKLPITDVTVDGSSPKEMFVGDLNIRCEDESLIENVDYEEASRWPVLLSILAIILVSFRTHLRDFFGRAT